MVVGALMVMSFQEIWQQEASRRQMASLRQELGATTDVKGTPFPITVGPGEQISCVKNAQGSNRKAGRALVADIMVQRVVPDDDVFNVAWARSPKVNDPFQEARGIHVGNYNRLSIQGAGPTIEERGFVTPIEYIFTIVLREKGAFYLLSSSGGGEIPQWPKAALLWADPEGNTSPLWPLVASSGGTLSVKRCSTVDLGAPWNDSYGIAKLKDTFSRPNSTDLGIPGNSGPWMEKKGDWAIQNGKLTTLSQDGGIVVVPAASDGMFDMEITTPSAGPVDTSLVFRYRDPDNYLRCRLTDEFVALQQVKNGEVTDLDGAENALGQPGRTHHLRAYAKGEMVRCSLDNEGLVGETIVVRSSFNLQQQLVGLERAAEDGGSTFSNFVVWPLEITMPSEAGPGPFWPKDELVTSLVEDFSGKDDMRLEEHGAATGRPWEEYGGQWKILQGKATFPGSLLGVAQAFAVLETGSADGEYSVDVILPPAIAQGRMFAGIAFRYQDRGNFMAARIIDDESGTWEIELIDVEGGTKRAFAHSDVVRFIAIKSLSPLITLADYDETHNLSVRTSGRWITVFLDGVPRITYEQARPPDSKAGLYSTEETVIQFDNLMVKTSPKKGQASP